MSIFYLFLLISVIAVLSILVILFLKVRRKYVNDLGSVATTPQMLAVVFATNIIGLWLIKDIPDLLIIIYLFISSIALFLLLKLTSDYFDKYSQPNSYNFFSGLMVIIICVATPLFSYALAYKYNSLILYIVYALINSSLAIGFSIFVIRLGNKLHITSH